MWKILIVVFSPITFAESKVVSKTQSTESALPVLTLEEAYQKTKARSEMVQVRNLMQQQATVAQSRARSGLLPQFEAEAGVLRQQLDSSTTGNNEREVSSVRLGLRQPLFRGFDQLGSVRMAEKDFEISKLNLKETERLLWWTVVNTYYQILAQEIDYQNLLALEEITEKREKEIRRRTGLGRSRASDLQVTIGQKLSIHAQVQRAKTVLATSQLQLSQLTGVDAEKFKLVPVKAKTIQRQNVQKSRPDLKALELAVQRAYWEVTKANSTVWPELDLAANYYPYYQAKNDTRTGGNLRWDLGLTLTWTMDWEDWTNRAGAERRLNLKVQELQYQKLSRESQEYLDRRHKYYEGVQLQIKDLNEAVKASEKALQLTQKDYANGTVNLLDVVSQLNLYFEIQRQFKNLEIENDLTALEIQWLQGADFGGEL